MLSGTDGGPTAAEPAYGGGVRGSTAGTRVGPLMRVPPRLRRPPSSYAVCAPYDSYDPRIEARNSPTQPSSSRPTSGLPPTFAVFGRGTSTWWTDGLMTVPG